MKMMRERVQALFIYALILNRNWSLKENSYKWLRSNQTIWQFYKILKIERFKENKMQNAEDYCIVLNLSFDQSWPVSIS